MTLLDVNILATPTQYFDSSQENQYRIIFYTYTIVSNKYIINFAFYIYVSFAVFRVITGLVYKTAWIS